MYDKDDIIARIYTPCVKTLYTQDNENNEMRVPCIIGTLLKSGRLLIWLSILFECPWVSKLYFLNWLPLLPFHRITMVQLVPLYLRKLVEGQRQTVGRRKRLPLLSTTCSTSPSHPQSAATLGEGPPWPDTGGGMLVTLITRKSSFKPSECHRQLVVARIII